MQRITELSSMFSSVVKKMPKNLITFLGQKEAYNSDQDLMSEQVGYSIDILMELAGQSVAHCLHHINEETHNGSIKKILVVCGPGNNGGDGMVAARHLAHYSNLYEPTILLLKQPTKQFFINQINLCKQYKISVKCLETEFQLQEVNATQKLTEFISSYDIILDALFGFSFQPPVKPPSDIVLEALKLTSTPIFSVDIPSGWDVEKGNIHNSFTPKYLISLTLPKEGSRSFLGRHFIGGRFVPTSIVEKYNWKMPVYPSNSTFIELE